MCFVGFANLFRDQKENDGKLRAAGTCCDLDSNQRCQNAFELETSQQDITKFHIFQKKGCNSCDHPV